MAAIRIGEGKLCVLISDVNVTEFCKEKNDAVKCSILSYFLLRLICKDVPWTSVTVLGFGAGNPME